MKDDPHITPPSEMDIDSLQTVNLPSLSGAQLTSLNAPFTEDEIAQAINTLTNGKSPGPDGYSNE